MGRNTSVSLGNHFENFVDERVKMGRYASASDAVRAGLRLLEQEETKLETLRAALISGEESGIAEDYDIEAIQRKLDSE